MEGGSFTRDFEGKCIIRGWTEEGSGNGHRCRGPVGELGGLHLLGILRDSGGL